MRANRVRWRALGCAVAVAGISCNADGAPKESAAFAGDSVREVTAETPSIRDREVIAELRTADGKPWLLVSGWDCSECDAPKTLFVQAVDDTTVVLGAYYFPGIYIEPGIDEAPNARVRAFFGACLDEPGDEVVWLVEQESAGSTTWERWAFVARPPEVESDTLPAWDARLEGRLESSSGCSELPGDTLYA
ncbi:MAG TPA: hypothetical protein VF039_13745 [Longimicrobiales bacterium]